MLTGLSGPPLSTNNHERMATSADTSTPGTTARERPRRVHQANQTLLTVAPPMSVTASIPVGASPSTRSPTLTAATAAANDAQRIVTSHDNAIGSAGGVATESVDERDSTVMLRATSTIVRQGGNRCYVCLASDARLRQFAAAM